MTKVCINGSRTFKSFERLEKELNTLLASYDRSGLEIVSGGAGGADTLAEQYAKKYDIKFTLFKAEWGKYGKPAGYIRNKLMVNYSDQLISFWDGVSRGTRHTFEYASEQNKPVTIIRV